MTFARGSLPHANRPYPFAPDARRLARAIWGANMSLDATFKACRQAIYNAHLLRLYEGHWLPVKVVSENPRVLAEHSEALPGGETWGTRQEAHLTISVAKNCLEGISKAGPLLNEHWQAFSRAVSRTDPLVIDGRSARNYHCAAYDVASACFNEWASRLNKYFWKPARELGLDNSSWPGSWGHFGWENADFSDGAPAWKAVTEALIANCIQNADGNLDQLPPVSWNEIHEGMCIEFSAATAKEAVTWSAPNTLKQWAIIFGLSENTLAAQFKGGDRRARKIGKLWSVDVAELPPDAITI